MKFTCSISSSCRNLTFNRTCWYKCLACVSLSLSSNLYLCNRPCAGLQHSPPLRMERTNLYRPTSNNLTSDIYPVLHKYKTGQNYFHIRWHYQPAYILSLCSAASFACQHTKPVQRHRLGNFSKDWERK